MQKTSAEYVESMKKPLRNRAYIKANIGIVNSEAQTAMNFDNEENDFIYFSNAEAVLNSIPVDKVYATAEEDFSTVDGKMYFLPSENDNFIYFNNGVVSEDILGSITVDFGELFDANVKGLTIDFGICYPTKFYIVTDNRRTYYENDSSLFITDDIFSNITFIKIEPVEMVNGNNRLRILSFLCGVTRLFTNETIISASITDYTNPISENLPSMDMSFTIDNQDQYYCPDDDESSYAALEQGQQMKIQFGYDVDGEDHIEWLPPYRCYLNSWSATDKEATFGGVDIFEYKMKDMYIYGNYYSDGISLYALAQDVFTKAGFAAGDYRIDEYLKELIVHNPLPIVSQAEALQIIANAGRCILRINRDGLISLESSFIPDFTIITNGERTYSNASDLMKTRSNLFYAEASQDFTTVDGTMIFIPTDSSYVENTGYISSNVYLGSNGGYNWDGQTPTITITFEASWSFYGLYIKFFSLVPEEVMLTSYLLNEVVDTWTYSDFDVELYADTKFDECDKIEISITKGSPNARVFIDSIRVSSLTDYKITRDFDMTDSPNAVRLEKVQSITVNTNDYLMSNDTQTAEASFTVNSGTTYQIVTFDKPGYNFAATILDGTATVSITERGAYYVKLQIISQTLQTIKIQLQGKCYDIAVKPYVKVYNTSGEIIEWNNPLISDLGHAEKIEKWLSQYYRGNADYDIKWRGDPCVDANDLFDMELKDLPTKTRDNVNIKAYQTKLDFNGAFSGELKARKVAL